MSIHIQNVYYLLCYAWDKLAAGEIIRSATDGERDVTNLLARVILLGTSYVTRRGLDRCYTDCSDAGPAVRGRIDVAATFARAEIATGRLQFRYQELNTDALHNQIIKSTLRALLQTDGIARTNQLEAATLLKKLHSVSDIRLDSKIFRRVRLHRNNAFYGMALDASELLFHNLLPSPAGDRYIMQHFAGAPRDMANLFERFVANFFRREQSEFRVSGQRLNWNEFQPTEQARRFLPVMRTDVVLRSAARVVLVDCKYYENALRETTRGLVVRPEHLYQITSYARNLRVTLPDECRLDAVLLYPVVDSWEDVTVDGAQYSVKIRFINLNQDWRAVHRDLLRVAGTVTDLPQEPVPTSG